jgi:long-chain acyl-CoA synthetase
VDTVSNRRAEFNLSRLLENAAAAHPERAALLGQPTSLSYEQLDAAASSVAHFLAGHGVRAGETVALTCANGADFPVLYYGILKAGCVVVPLNVLLNARELAHQLRDSKSAVIVCVGAPEGPPQAATVHAAADRVPSCREVIVIEPGERLYDKLRPYPPQFHTVGVAADDVAVVVYPSRSLGAPMGVALTHAGLAHNASAVADALYSAVQPQVYLVVLPLFHLVPQTMQLNAGMISGATLLLQPRFEPVAALAAMGSEGVTALVGVPTTLWTLLEAAEKHPDVADAAASTLQLACSELAALSPEVGERFRRRFSADVLEGYGLSETGSVSLHARPGDNRPGSVGRPLPGTHVRLVGAGEGDAWSGPGEIEVRGPAVMKAYLGRPNDTAAVLHGGWFRTGDLARRAPDGHYYMDDRPKRMIVRAGLAVYPRAVEEALLTHPAISTATVVGIPHPRYGEELRTVLVRRPGAVISEAELVAWARQQLPGFTDSSIEVRDASLPETPEGLDRRTGRRESLRRMIPGFGLAAVGTAIAFLINRLAPVVSPLTAGVILGVLLTNTFGVPTAARAGLTVVTRRLLRAGVVLLGLQLSLPQLLELGAPILAVVAATVLIGFFGTVWIGARLKLSRNLTMLTATGFSICGASAIAAIDSAIDSDEDEVATAIALVTIFGSIALLTWPLLQPLLGLGDEAYGAWAGASIHEVAQVVAAASPAGAAALAAAVVVKLSRVVFLAPLVGVVTLAARRQSNSGSGGDQRRTPLVPAFLLGFLAMIVVRSTEALPAGVLDTARVATSLLLAAALFGLGSGVRVRVLIATGPRALVLGAASTVLMAAIAYAGVLLAMPTS